MIICDHPTIIVNPNLGELLCKYHTYYMAGVRHFYKYNYRALVSYNQTDFYRIKPTLKEDDLTNYYVVDEVTGTTYPIYLAVPCGQCPLCKERKVNSFVGRCVLESQCYDTLPWFVTLTYADEPTEGVNVRDVQLFFKRFRICLQRLGFDEQIRYVCVSEYGKRTHRAHYHCIIWGLSTFNFYDYKDIECLLRASWSNGFVMSRVIDCRSTRTFYYTSKYLTKGCVVPAGKHPTFMCSSNRKGGIGAPFADNIKDELRRTLNVNFKFLNKWTNKVQSVCWSSYLLNRIFPSAARYVGSDLRVACREFNYYYDELKLRCPEYVWLFDDLYDTMYRQFADYIYFGQTLPNNEHQLCGLSDAQVMGKLFDAERVIKRHIDKDISQSLVLDNLRQRFLGRLGLTMPSQIDLVTKSFTARKKHLRAYATEQL